MHSNGDAWAERVTAFNERWLARLRPVGMLLVDLFHFAGLFVIGAATVWSAIHAFMEVLAKRPYASIEDLLLLFIFLEIGAMVGIYFKTNHMPVRFLVYVAITAVTRHMIAVLNHVKGLGLEMIVTAGTLLLLAVALLAIRYASFNYPAGDARKPSFKTDADPNSTVS
jgi:protein PsiE